MIDIAKELAVQSYCFRNFKDNVKVASMVKQIGVSAIELCGVHIDWFKESLFDEVIKIYRDAGVKIGSIGVNYLDGKADERKMFEFVKKAGAKFMSISFQIDAVPNVYRATEKLAEEYDIKCGIHNHGGRHWLGSAEMLTRVFKDTSPRIGLTMDCAWALHAHEDPIAMVEKFADRFFGLHLKDFTFDRAGKHQDVVVGTGNLDLPRLKQALAKINFNGYAVLEYEADADNPVPALTECVKSIKEKMA